MLKELGSSFIILCLCVASTSRRWAVSEYNSVRYVEHVSIRHFWSNKANTLHTVEISLTRTIWLLVAPHPSIVPCGFLSYRGHSAWTLKSLPWMTYYCETRWSWNVNAHVFASPAFVFSMRGLWWRSVRARVAPNEDLHHQQAFQRQQVSTFQPVFQMAHDASPWPAGHYCNLHGSRETRISIHKKTHKVRENGRKVEQPWNTGSAVKTHWLIMFFLLFQTTAELYSSAGPTPTIEEQDVFFKDVLKCTTRWCSAERDHLTRLQTSVWFHFTIKNKLVLDLISELFQLALWETGFLKTVHKNTQPQQSMFGPNIYTLYGSTIKQITASNLKAWCHKSPCPCPRKRNSHPDFYTHISGANGDEKNMTWTALLLPDLLFSVIYIYCICWFYLTPWHEEFLANMYVHRSGILLSLLHRKGHILI